MKVQISWLKQYVDVDLEPKALAHRMTLAGVEAEGVTLIGEGWENVFVGVVEEIKPHPNADRLRLATVSLGTERETVVCGAPNVATGQKIAFARAGANLMDAHTGKREVLKPAKIRGVESRGMVCSERELGLSTEHEGILVLPEDAPVGMPFAQYYGDAIITFAPTANRPDCLSMLGIAHEVAAITGKAVRMPSLDYPETGEPAASKTSVEIEAPDLCLRYIAGVVTGVRVAPSPRWMQERLKAGGMRPINNVVDITNYVMLEFGQPLHAFDYDKLEGHRIIARKARDGETMPFIDGQERKLTAGMLAIADARRPAALAGVMGGGHTEVSDSTTTILLESACFNNTTIRKTSRELALRSEASSRFEKGLSPELPMHAARRAMQLLVQITGGSACKGLVDVYPGHRVKRPVIVTTERIKKVLGVEVTTQEIAQALVPLGMESKEQVAGALAVTPPYWRIDINIEEDLIEEVARVKGYEWVPMTATVGELPAFEPQPMFSLKERVRDIFSAAGVDEIITYPLTNADTQRKSHASGQPPLRAVHPISSDLEEMRLTLRGSILRTLAANQRLQERGVRLFEVGRVYIPRKEDLPQEKEMVAAVWSGPRRGGLGDSDGDLDFFDAKGVIEEMFTSLGLEASYIPAQDPLLHEGKTAQVVVGGGGVGLVGEVHPSTISAFDLLPRPVAFVEIDLGRLLPLIRDRAHMYKPISRFPTVIRDIALVIDAAILADRVAAIIQATPLVQSVELFDVYTGDKMPAGKKSLAYRIVYQASNRTLTSDEAQKAQDRLLERLKKDLDATLRV